MMNKKDDCHNIFYGFLHNRKTGGTALKEVIETQRQRTPGMNVKYFKHSWIFPRFVKNQPHMQAVFFIREPLSRFVSGFYSRQRQGRPKYNIPWNKKEARAFARFPTANSLAEALSDKSWRRRWQARAAMKSIANVCHTYKEYFSSLAFLKKYQCRVAYIGHQPELNDDLERLRMLWNLDADLIAPTDDVRAHRNPAHVDKYLSETATINLQKWYRADIEIYEWCLQKRKQLIHKIDT